MQRNLFESSLSGRPLAAFLEGRNSFLLTEYQSSAHGYFALHNNAHEKKDLKS